MKIVALWLRKVTRADDMLMCEYQVTSNGTVLSKTDLVSLNRSKQPLLI